MPQDYKLNENLLKFGTHYTKTWPKDSSWASSCPFPVPGGSHKVHWPVESEKQALFLGHQPLTTQLASGQQQDWKGTKLALTTKINAYPWPLLLKRKAKKSCYLQQHIGFEPPSTNTLWNLESLLREQTNTLGSFGFSKLQSKVCANWYSGKGNIRGHEIYLHWRIHSWEPVWKASSCWSNSLVFWNGGMWKTLLEVIEKCFLISVMAFILSLKTT